MRQDRGDVREVLDAYPIGARMFCERNCKYYQMGAKFGRSEFWLFCETDSTKGTVDAAVILRDFRRLD
jgi:hypothetical protein